MLKADCETCKESSSTEFDETAACTCDSAEPCKADCDICKGKDTCIKSVDQDETIGGDEVEESDSYALKDNNSKTETVDGNDIVTTVDEDSKTVTTTKYAGDKSTGKLTETTVDQYSDDGENIVSTTVTEYTYDDSGSKTSETVTVNGATTKETTYANGTATTKEYDADGQVSKTILSAPSGSVDCVYEFKGDSMEEENFIRMIAYGMNSTSIVSGTLNESVSKAFNGKYIVEEFKVADFSDEDLSIYSDALETMCLTAYEDNSQTTPVAKYYVVYNENYDSYETQLLYDANGKVTTKYTTEQVMVDDSDEINMIITDTTTNYDENGNVTSQRIDNAVNPNSTLVGYDAKYQTATETKYETVDGVTREISSTSYKLSGINGADIENQKRTAESTTSYESDGSSTKKETSYIAGTDTKTADSVTTYDAVGKLTGIAATTYADDGETPVSGTVTEYSDGKIAKSTLTNYADDGTTAKDATIAEYTSGVLTKTTAMTYAADGTTPSKAVITEYRADEDIAQTTEITYDENGKETGIVVKDKAGNITESTEVNEDGSTVKTENKADGSTIVTTTAADGTVTAVNTAADNSSTTTVTNPDGSSVTTVKDAEDKLVSITTVSAKDADGSYTVIVRDAEDNVTDERKYNANGSYVKKGYTPDMIGQSNTSYTGYAPLFFRSNDEYINFLGVRVDGKDVPADCYESRSGSIIVTLKQSFLNTLDAGDHKVEIVSTNGSAEASFNISEATVALISGSSSPRTGDSSNIVLFSALLLVSFAGLVVLPTALRKKSK